MEEDGDDGFGVVEMADGELGRALERTIEEIANKVNGGTNQGMQVGTARISEKEVKVYMKQTVVNYLIAILGDVRRWIGTDGKFKDEEFLEERGSQDFYKVIVGT